MTKIRSALSLEKPISTIGTFIGWEGAAVAVSAHRIRPITARAVRNWTDSNTTPKPTIQDALAMDLAYIAAGGDHAPILQALAAHVGIALATSPAASLIMVAAEIANESGEAVHAVLKASQPGASQGQIEIARTELIDVRDAIDDGLRCLDAGGGQRSRPPPPPPPPSRY